MFTMCKHMLR